MANQHDVKSFLEGEFSKVGAEARPTVAGIEVTFDGVQHEYSMPMLTEDYPYLPGWFAAGIWDDMNLPSAHEFPDAQVFYGWNFTPVGGTNFTKALGEDKTLIYNSSNNTLFIQNIIAQSLTEVGPWPIKSIFHALKLFQESGFFPETGNQSVASQNVADYRIR